MNHTRLIQQIWAVRIHDKALIFVLRKILTAQIKSENGTFITPDKGAPQGGIISPFLANIVLNELDHWVEGQWQWSPIYKRNVRPESGYKQTKKSSPKGMFIVRYAGDFRTYRGAKDTAERTIHVAIQWLRERLKLETSEKETRIIGVRNHYSDFLGFKMEVHRKDNRLMVISYIADKNFDHKRQKLKTQARRIVHPQKIYGEQGEIRLYNSMVTGMQNYYCITTHINHDYAILNHAAMTLLTNGLDTRGGNRLVKTGRELTEFERSRFGKSKMIRYVTDTNEPVYPIGHTQHRSPLFRKKTWNYYTPEGQEGARNNLRISMTILLSLIRKPPCGYSAEYADNRVSLFSAQWRKCTVTGEEFSSTHEIHCHYKLLRYLRGDDSYGSLILVKDSVRKLIYAIDADTIAKYLGLLQLDKSQLRKVSTLRELASLPLI